MEIFFQNSKCFAQAFTIKFVKRNDISWDPVRHFELMFFGKKQKMKIIDIQSKNKYCVYRWLGTNRG